MTWTPIDDKDNPAPRDGTVMLFVNDDWITTGYWNKYRNDWCENGPHYPPYPPDEQPTHYMPLPEPPEDG